MLRNKLTNVLPAGRQRNRRTDRQTERQTYGWMAYQPAKQNGKDRQADGSVISFSSILIDIDRSILTSVCPICNMKILIESRCYILDVSQLCLFDLLAIETQNPLTSSYPGFQVQGKPTCTAYFDRAFSIPETNTMKLDKS